MSQLLVRRRFVEASERPAGRFDQHRFGGRLLPSFAIRSVGTHCVDTTERVYSLTYDDGPDPDTTPPVLDMLQRHGARATFFVLSEPARRHPDIIRRIVEDGHELALHGDTHQSLLTMSGREMARRLRDARAVLEDISGSPISLYRPPYGAYTLPRARRIRRLGLDLTIWSGDAHDWVDGEEAAIAERAISGVFPGAILLLHDTRADPETLGEGEALPAFDRADVLDRILTTTRAAGYGEERVGTLVTRLPRVKTIIAERMRRA